MSPKNRKHKSAPMPKKEPAFNPYLDEYMNLMGRLRTSYPAWGKRGFAGFWDRLLSARQRKLCFQHMSLILRKKYAWAIPNQEALDELAQWAPLIEIGSGTGYWVSLLRKMGVDIVAYDIAPISSHNNQYHKHMNFAAVLRGDANMVTQHPGRTLFLCYPPAWDDSRMSSEALNLYQGNTLAFAGFPTYWNNPTTGDHEFHRQLNAEWDLVKAIPLPTGLDFGKIEPDPLIPPGIPWLQVSTRYLKDKLYIFKRKGSETT